MKYFYCKSECRGRNIKLKPLVQRLSSRQAGPLLILLVLLWKIIIALVLYQRKFGLLVYWIFYHLQMNAGPIQMIKNNTRQLLP